MLFPLRKIHEVEQDNSAVEAAHRSEIVAESAVRHYSHHRQNNTDCPVCKTNMSECTGVAPEPETPVEDDPADTSVEEPEKKSNMGMIIGVIAVVGIGGAAYYYFKFVRGKKQKDEDLDFFDDEGYEEEPYVNEDAEPDIAEDDEETEDEEV